MSRIPFPLLIVRGQERASLQRRGDVVGEHHFLPPKVKTTISSKKVTRRCTDRRQLRHSLLQFVSDDDINHRHSDLVDPCLVPHISSRRSCVHGKRTHLRPYWAWFVQKRHDAALNALTPTYVRTWLRRGALSTVDETEKRMGTKRSTGPS